MRRPTRQFGLTLAFAAITLAAGCAPESANVPHFGWDTDVAGKKIAMNWCSDCHGIDGNPVSPQFPRLAGQQEAYLVKQLKEFQTEHRSDPTGSAYMWGIARVLTAKQIKEIAEYFSAQKALPGPPGNPALANQGKELFHQGIAAKGVPACATCHGPEGLGSGETPRLADQWSHYILAQLDVFHTEQRPAGVAMHAIVAALTPEDMKALATYLQSIGGK
jgi:cbb3-type cytochrome c oxidase subunit III